MTNLFAYHTRVALPYSWIRFSLGSRQQDSRGNREGCLWEARRQNFLSRGNSEQGWTEPVKAPFPDHYSSPRSLGRGCWAAEHWVGEAETVSSCSDSSPIRKYRQPKSVWELWGLPLGVGTETPGFQHCRGGGQGLFQMHGPVWRVKKS